MSRMHLDSYDRKLLNRLQAEFPLTEKPYAALGQQLSIDEGEVILRIKQLKLKGIIRQISPVLDARSLGYQSTLVAMRVAETQLAKIERLIIGHPGVSHGYERDHRFNLWFTLSSSSTANLETELERLTETAGAEVAFSLPAVKLFKIGAYFDMDGDGQQSEVLPGVLNQRVELSAADRLVINELQQDLPLVAAPFTGLAARLGMDAGTFLVHCQSLLQRGIMRRFGASVNHHRAGFRANAMTCWVALPDTVDAAGREVASLREVSHCYERKTNSLWPYNLFAMVHSHSQDDCQKIVDDISHRIGLNDYVLLYSTKEFKKTRIKYLV